MSKNNNSGFLSAGAVIGVLIILWGISLVFKGIFPIQFPVFRILFGAALIYLGARFVTGGFRSGWASGGGGFGNTNSEYTPGQTHYNIAFGQGRIDLSTMGPVVETRYIEVNIVFGDAEIKLPTAVPALVDIHSVFAAATSPDRSATALGRLMYRTPGLDENAPHLRLKVSVVFGRAAVIDQ